MKLRTERIDNDTFHITAAGRLRASILRARDPRFWQVQIELNPNIGVLYPSNFANPGVAIMAAEIMWKISRQSHMLNRMDEDPVV